MSIEELANALWTAGARLEAEGDRLRVFAPHGRLEASLIEQLAEHRPEILALLRGQMPVRLESARVDWNAEATLEPELRPRGPARKRPIERVLLTGATGFLGCYLLRELLESSEAHVTCLVRARDRVHAQERLRACMERYELWRAEMLERITVVVGDLAQPRLGISEAAWSALRDSIDTVFHNGAKLNWIVPYAGVRDENVGGTTEIIRLCCEGDTKALHHISSLGVFPFADAATCFDEQTALGDPERLTGGYAQSKWVAEQKVQEAGRRGLPVAIYRPGLIVGDSETGAWNESDIVCRLLKGCLQLGLAPAEYVAGLYRMATVDQVAGAVVQLATAPPQGSGVFHLPGQVVTFEQISRWLADFGYGLTLAPYRQWRAALLASLDAEGEQNALAPLMPIFGPEQAAMPAMTSKFEWTQTRSALPPSLRSRAIDDVRFGRYLGYFRRIAFIAPPPQSKEPSNA